MKLRCVCLRALWRAWWWPASWFPWSELPSSSLPSYSRNYTKTLFLFLQVWESSFCSQFSSFEWKNCCREKGLRTSLPWLLLWFAADPQLCLDNKKVIEKTEESCPVWTWGLQVTMKQAWGYIWSYSSERLTIFWLVLNISFTWLAWTFGLTWIWKTKMATIRGIHCRKQAHFLWCLRLQIECISHVFFLSSNSTQQLGLQSYKPGSK